MKIKLSNEKLLNTTGALQYLNNTKLPVKLAYAIRKNIQKINNEIKFYEEERQKLINLYGEKDKEGNLKVDKNNNIPIKKEFLEEWNREISELLSIENEIDIHMIKLDVLLNSNCELSPAELNFIDFMIEE